MSLTQQRAKELRLWRFCLGVMPSLIHIRNLRPQVHTTLPVWRVIRAGDVMTLELAKGMKD